MFRAQPRAAPPPRSLYFCHESKATERPLPASRSWSPVPGYDAPMSADTKTAATSPSTRGSASKTYEVDDAFAANELYQDNGWTDGLPIVPPTEKLDRACLYDARLGPSGWICARPTGRRRPNH